MNDRDIDKFLKLLDHDKNGSLSINELGEFVERGAAALNTRTDDGEDRGLAWARDIRTRNN